MVMSIHTESSEGRSQHSQSDQRKFDVPARRSRLYFVVVQARQEVLLELFESLLALWVDGDNSLVELLQNRLHRLRHLHRADLRRESRIIIIILIIL